MRRRHDHVGVVREHPIDDRTFVSRTGHDGGKIDRFGAVVEPQTRFATRLVGAVTQEAIIRQHRADVAIEVNLAIRGTMAGDGLGTQGNAKRQRQNERMMHSVSRYDFQ